MQTTIRKNATKKIDLFLSNATHITLTTHVRDVDGSFDAETRTATAQEVKQWITDNYGEKIRLSAHTNKKGEYTYFEVKGEYNTCPRFVVRLDDPAQLEAIKEKANTIGAEVHGNGELAIMKGNECVIATDDLARIESALDSIIDKAAKLSEVTEATESGAVVAAEFVVKRLEQDVKTIFCNVNTNPNISTQFNQLVIRLKKLGFTQSDSVKMVKLTANNIGASLGLKPLFEVAQ